MQDAPVALLEVARLQANVAHLQAEAILALLQRDTLKPVVSVAQHTPAACSPADIPTGMLINERVGSISIADWESMTEARLRRLDLALKKIVETAMVPSIAWKQVGVVIQSELASAGFVFSTVCDSTKYGDTGGWKEAENKALPDLVRVRGAARDAARAMGTYMWMEEMLRILVRLMELRGM